MDSNKMRINAEQLASKLEEKASMLRESGLSCADMEKVIGGDAQPGCCGSSCSENSTWCHYIETGRPDVAVANGCQRSCVSTSPD